MKLVKELIKVCFSDIYVFLEFLVFIVSVILFIIGYFKVFEPLKFLVLLCLGIYINRRKNKNEV